MSTTPHGWNGLMFHMMSENTSNQEWISWVRFTVHLMQPRHRFRTFTMSQTGHRRCRVLYHLLCSLRKAQSRIKENESHFWLILYLTCQGLSDPESHTYCVCLWTIYFSIFIYRCSVSSSSPCSARNEKFSVVRNFLSISTIRSSTVTKQYLLVSRRCTIINNIFTICN